MKLAVLAVAFVGAVALLAACPPPTPPSPPPDASDAAPAPPEAGPAPPAPSSPCDAACAAMTKAGCVVQPDCSAVLTRDTAARRIRNAKTGAALTCPELAAVQTSADVKALGQSCGP